MRTVKRLHFFFFFRTARFPILFFCFFFFGFCSFCFFFWFWFFLFFCSFALLFFLFFCSFCSFVLLDASVLPEKKNANSPEAIHTPSSLSVRSFRRATALTRRLGIGPI
ncbi:MAG: hypothetical protein EBZ77_09125 [Chitinophagia bacterium]|nr:hypothetical protein [Chitinophagia bacterium]